MTDAVRIPCAMSGEREVLTVYPVGKGGVSFCYGDDASVIVDGDALLKVRAIIDQQIAPPPPANIGADSPSVREKALREALRAFQSYGCPVCGGDCSAANPPVSLCPMQEAEAALATATQGGSDA